MDPLKLEIFVTINDCNSLYKASLLLKIPSEKLLEVIRALETELDAKVFTDEVAPRLTFAGHMLYIRALGILDSWYIAQGIVFQLQASHRC